MKGSIKPSGLPEDFAGYKSIQFTPKWDSFIANVFSLQSLVNGKNIIKSYFCEYQTNEFSQSDSKGFKYSDMECRPISNLPNGIGNGIVV